VVAGGVVLYSTNEFLTISMLPSTVDEIGGELHSQYTISYTPTGADVPGYHEIKVTLVQGKMKDLKVRARPGYYLGPPES